MSSNRHTRRNHKKIFVTILLSLVISSVLVSCQFIDSVSKKDKTTINIKDKEIVNSKESVGKNQTNSKKNYNNNSDEKSIKKESSDGEKVDREVGEESEVLNNSNEKTGLETSNKVDEQSDLYQSDTDISDTPDILATNKVHNIFRGTIEDEEIIMELYLKKGKVSITYVGNDRTKEHNLNGIIKDQTIIAKNSDNKTILTLNMTDKNIFSGECYDNGEKKDVDIQFVYVIGGAELDKRYELCDDSKENDKIEVIAQTIIDEINNSEMEPLSNIVAYPIIVNGKEVTIDNDIHFKQLTKIFTPYFKAVIKNSFSKFMYNTKDGIRIGSDKYNIWIAKIEDEWKIVAINN